MSLLGDCFDDSGSGSDRSSTAPARAVMGDVYCTKAEAVAAGAAVREMNAVYEHAGQPSQFKVYVDSVNVDWKKYDSAWVFYTYCEAKAIGQRAQSLAQEIAVTSGQRPPAADPELKPGPFSGAASAFGAFVSTVAVGLTLYAGVEAFNKLRRGKGQR